VTIAEGGRALVRVSDDGSGMPRDDAVLALSRHATSKIRSADELVGVASFGFRGEALPAICSVAELELVTAEADGRGRACARPAGGSTRWATRHVGAAPPSRSRGCSTTRPRGTSSCAARAASGGP
jgi:DNA mismatch repair protein MutL